MKLIEDDVKALLSGCDSVYSADELKLRLENSAENARPLRVKLGMDPTAPDLHLGHAVVLRKLRQFQDLGHKGVLIIGDYTAMIGDPTGRSKARPMLTSEQVDANAKTYLQQAGKVLDVSPEKLEIRRNSEWLAPMRFEDVIRLTAQVTVARMMERDTFAKRQKHGLEIYIHELLYPLMQAWDSVQIRSDVELGGTDQTFNNLMGRDLQRNAAQPPQIVMVMPLLLGTDGKEKMSKSMGNYVGVTDPAAEMFGKVMSISDELMVNYYSLLTSMSPSEVAVLSDPQRTHPRDAKVRLAKAITTEFHDAAAAQAAEEEFFRIHGAGKTGVPDEMSDVVIPIVAAADPLTVLDLVRQSGFASSNGEARRLIAESGVRLNGEVLSDPFAKPQLKDGDVLQRGKRKFVRLRVRGG